LSSHRIAHNGLQLQEVGDYEVPHMRDMSPKNPARAGHKALFNPDPSGSRQFIVGAVAQNLR